MYQLICMSFDGEYKTEKPEFDTIDEAWDYSNDLGSKWYFYPFHFVIEISKNMVADTGPWLEHLIGMTVEEMEEIFMLHSKDPEMENADFEEFALTI